MGSILRVVIVALVFQTVLFGSLWFYARARKREKLEAEWQAKGSDLPKETYISAGLSTYEGPLKRNLIWGTYVLPTSLIVLLITLTTTD